MHHESFETSVKSKILKDLKIFKIKNKSLALKFVTENTQSDIQLELNYFKNIQPEPHKCSHKYCFFFFSHIAY